MKKSYSALAVAAVSMTFMAAGSGAAQEPIPAAQRISLAPAASVTLTGCVARGVEPGSYTLTNVTKPGTGTSKEAERSATVSLSGADVEFSKHLDHMVAVTGSQAFPAGPVGTAGTEKPAVQETRKDADKKTIETFTVTSLKMVADSCAKPSL
jgi:hypothetical protein